jgi:hypothetical protein
MHVLPRYFSLDAEKTGREMDKQHKEPEICTVANTPFALFQQ